MANNMINTKHPLKEPNALACFLTGRYGCLALTRAAGEAAAAARRGEIEENALWAKVVDRLRQTLVSEKASNPA